MKDLVIILLLALLVFFIWNGRQTASYDGAYISTPQAAPVGPDDAPVAPEVTQRILDQIKTGEIPIETLFVKKVDDGKYSARFMFYNPADFTGVQYDVAANVSDSAAEITGQTVVTESGDEWNPAYRGDEYTPWSAISASAS